MIVDPTNRSVIGIVTVGKKERMFVIGIDGTGRAFVILIGIVTVGKKERMIALELPSGYRSCCSNGCP